MLQLAEVKKTKSPLQPKTKQKKSIEVFQIKKEVLS